MTRDEARYAEVVSTLKREISIEVALTNRLTLELFFACELLENETDNTLIEGVFCRAELAT